MLAVRHPVVSLANSVGVLRNERLGGDADRCRVTLASSDILTSRSSTTLSGRQLASKPLGGGLGVGLLLSRSTRLRKSPNFIFSSHGVTNIVSSTMESPRPSGVKSIVTVSLPTTCLRYASERQRRRAGQWSIAPSISTGMFFATKSR